MKVNSEFVTKEFCVLKGLCKQKSPPASIQNICRKIYVALESEVFHGFILKQNICINQFINTLSVDSLNIKLFPPVSAN